jgi:hypothetical protein
LELALIRKEVVELVARCRTNVAGGMSARAKHEGARERSRISDDVTATIMKMKARMTTPSFE